MFFFFQAEDGIRDYKVTGVQTCALPIFIVFGRIVRHSSVHARDFETHVAPFCCYSYPFASKHLTALIATAHAKSRGRSEERRVGKSVDLGGRRIIKKKKKERTSVQAQCR